MYTKDTRQFRNPANFSNTFGKVDDVALSLINSCKYIHFDNIKKREYVYDAISYDITGNVYFKKRYLRKNS